MKVVAQIRVDITSILLVNDLVVKCVVSQFVSIHGDGGGLDRSLEAIVVVTLVVGQHLNVKLGHLGSVNYNFIVDRQGCCSMWILIGHHIEIEDLVVSRSDHLVIDNCAWSRVDDISVDPLKESGGASLVDENEKQSWVVAFLVRVDGLTKLTIGTFQSETMLLHSRTSNTVSVDDDLLWNQPLVLELEVFNGI